MAAGTLSPSPKQYFWNLLTGAPLAGGFVYTYVAGTTTPAATYLDSALSTVNTNPIIINGAGYATIYLRTGNTYKFIVTDSAGVAVYTQDGIEADPSGSSAVVDYTGSTSDSFSVGMAGYLSDGSGSKTAGNWYLADSANPYSSTLPLVGIAVTIASGTVTFRGQGTVSGLVALSAGSTYYVGTAGALTTTAPSNARVVGVADSTTTQLNVDANPPSSGGLDLLQIEAMLG